MAFGEGYGVGLVRSTSFGRIKRVGLSNDGMGFGGENEGCKRLRLADDSALCAQKSAIEDLPEEILNRILCGVEHDDLKKLFLVSKTIRDATLIAKESHFAYSTPRKTVGFRNIDENDELNEVEPPNAPKQSKAARSRLSAKKLAGIAVSLFASF